jgi:hypothetical protein
MRKTKSEQVFEMNRNTSIAIKSKKKGEDYTHKIVLTHTIVSRSPLVPTRQEEVIDLIGGIDLEEDQTELPLSGGGR